MAKERGGQTKPTLKTVAVDTRKMKPFRRGRTTEGGRKNMGSQMAVKQGLALYQQRLVKKGGRFGKKKYKAPRLFDGALKLKHK